VISGYFGLLAVQQGLDGPGLLDELAGGGMFFPQLDAGYPTTDRRGDDLNRGPASGQGPVGHQIEREVEHA
jgi:hypothetical protein